MSARVAKRQPARPPETPEEISIVELFCDDGAHLRLSPERSAGLHLQRIVARQNESRPLLRVQERRLRNALKAVASGKDFEKVFGLVRSQSTRKLVTQMRDAWIAYDLELRADDKARVNLVGNLWGENQKTVEEARRKYAPLARHALAQQLAIFRGVMTRDQVRAVCAIRVERVRAELSIPKKET